MQENLISLLKWNVIYHLKKVSHNYNHILIILNTTYFASIKHFSLIVIHHLNLAVLGHFIIDTLYEDACKRLRIAPNSYEIAAR